jgi:Vacuolar protein 14 C-terminal Fig4p binding
VYIRNKATKQLTLTWLQELSEKLVGAPILEFVHLFLGGIFDMIADPTIAIRQSALAFLQSVLPKLLVLNSDTPIDENGMTVDFDKILQSLVCSMEHPDPTVRKVAVYWMSRIVKAHIGDVAAVPEAGRKKSADGTDMSNNINNSEDPNRDGDQHDDEGGSVRGVGDEVSPMASAASSSVRTSLPHVLPGILLSVGDTIANDSFLPDQTTRALAEQTNACLQDSVRRDGPAYVQHLDGFIVALREELDSPGGFVARNTPAIERSPYRMDVKQDGTGIESPGWFRTSSDTKERADTAMVLSRQCALTWVSVLYEFVVPTPLKADYAREFVIPIIHQLVDNPPKGIVYKSLEVLAKITVPVSGEEPRGGSATSLGVSSPLSSNLGSGTELRSPAWAASAAAAVGASSSNESAPPVPMNEASIDAALDILGPERRRLISRDRKVFSALIQLHSYNEVLLSELTSVLTYMCRLQPPEFVMISFSVELDRFIRKQKLAAESGKHKSFAKDLRFVSSFIQHMCHVLLNSDEAKEVRDVLMDCVGSKPSIASTEHDRQRIKVFHILLHSFAHNLPSALSLCLWSGAFRSAFLFLGRINPMDIDLMFLVEIDRLVEMLERPIFRRLHIRMLEKDTDVKAEGSGTMLFRTLKSLLMIIPKSTCYTVLRDRLNSVSKFRQSTITVERFKPPKSILVDRDIYVARVLQVRAMHCEAEWQVIRAMSLETRSAENNGMENGTLVSTSRKSKNGTKVGADELDSKQDNAMQKTGTSGANVTDSIDEQRWKLYWANVD